MSDRPSQYGKRTRMAVGVPSRDQVDRSWERHQRQFSRESGLTEYLDEMVRFQVPGMESGSG